MKILQLAKLAQKVLTLGETDKFKSLEFNSTLNCLLQEKKIGLALYYHKLSSFSNHFLAFSGVITSWEYSHLLKDCENSIV